MVLKKSLCLCAVLAVMSQSLVAFEGGDVDFKKLNETFREIDKTSAEKKAIVLAEKQKEEEAYTALYNEAKRLSSANNSLSECRVLNKCVYGEFFDSPIDYNMELLKRGVDNSNDRLLTLGSSYYKAGDFEKAMYYFDVAEKRGSIQAKFNLGYMYRNGLGVKTDIQKAVDYFFDAANAGDQKSAHELGDLYSRLDQTDPHKSLGINYLIRASKNGEESALIRLASIFADGDGVPQNDVLAYAMLKYCERKNEPFSVSIARDNLKKRMTPSQLNEAYALSKDKKAILSLID
jgi:TPR repeat protein